MTLRLALSTRTLEPELAGTLDGIGVYTQALRQHLPSQGVSVQGYTFVKAHEAPLLQNSLAIPGSYRAHLIGTLTGLPPRWSPPADVVHFTDHRVVRTRLPTVATVHDAIPLRFPQWVPGRLRPLRNWLLKRTIATADRFIAVSHFAVQELVADFGLPEDRVSVVPNGIDDAWLTEPPADAAQRRAACGIPALPYWLTIGTFQPRKNFDRVLAAYEQLPVADRDATALVIVGRAGWHCDDTVATIQRMQQAGRHVVWVRNLHDRTTLRAIYAGAQALVFPTLYEGFGLPVLEGFASDVPVITSTAASLPEVAGDAALLVEPTQTEAITAAMQQLLHDEALCERLRRAGRQRVQQFSWQATAQRTAAIYREMASRSTAGSASLTSD